MPDQNLINPFDANLFLDSLMEEMGMCNEPPETVAELRHAMEKQLVSDVLSAASLHIEPEVIDIALAEYGNETDPLFFIRQLIARSPAAQIAILEAMDTFYKQTLETFNAIKK